MASEQAGRCATCRWFKPVLDPSITWGGWCDWRAPMRMRHILWGSHNERIMNPEKEWCSEHRTADAPTGDDRS